MSIFRVAVIYDDHLRPETTGGYCLRSLRELVEVEHFQPDELATLRDGFDLYLRIDDGLPYQIPDRLKPSAFWAIDTHMDFARCLSQARKCDFVFAAQKDGSLQLQHEGMDAIWLPLACDPSIHRRHNVPLQYDVCFVGNEFPGPRQDLLDRIQQWNSKVFVGQRYFDEMAKIYSASHIVFNRSVKNDLNMRVFEALACGSLLMTNALDDNGQAELFQDEVHLATYREADELLDKIAFYLRRPDIAQRMAERGVKEVCEKHTYKHRMERILDTCKNGNTIRSAVVSKNSSKARETTTHNPGYYEFARPDILKRVPDTAKRILDIGCGAGRLAESIKKRQSAHVTGIEFNPQVAKRAQTHVDSVIEGDIEQLDLDFTDGQFDCVICGDVLEHLRDPLETLRRIRTWLGPEGTLVASIPNVRHHSVLRGLLQGNWTYEPAGLLDQTHLRFFTKREIEKLFFRSGFEISETTIVPGEGYQQWLEKGCPGKVQVGRLHIGGLETQDAEEFYVYQYLVTAQPAPAVNRKLTSIVILTHNQLAFTRQCLDSIFQFTDELFELIVVDNASTDGTVKYLQSIPNVQLIRNSENRGFPAAANQGIQAAKGSQVLLLNNDVIVTTGWLARMLSALEADSKIGLVGPSSNLVSGKQQISVDYDDLRSLDGFAWSLGQKHHGHLEEADRLIGFCLLIRCEVIDEIGLLDEQFGLGCFEDDDYCLRALHAGYRAVIARDAFVHHFAGRTFEGSGVDFQSLMKQNQKLFQQKWSKQPQLLTMDQSAPSQETPALVAERFPGGGLLLKTSSPKLSLCMIVRDNENTIRPALETIRPWVDEMIVVDTGSKDRTPEICQSLGAKLYHFPWCDDFSAARNESLKYATGEWIFWMDSDDTIPADCGRQLRETIRNSTDPTVLGWVVQVHCPGRNGHTGVTAVDHVKLIRNLPQLRFEGRIHEQIISAIRDAGGEIGWTDAYVVHSGSDQSPEGRKRKIERDLRILHKELQEKPEHPFVLFNLGMTYGDVDEHQQAIDFLERCLKVSQPNETHVGKTYAWLIGNYRAAGQEELAWEACRRGLRLFPDDPELLFRAGGLHDYFGRLEDAARCYEAALQPRTKRYFKSMDQGITGYKARQNLAVALCALGRWNEAEAHLRLQIEEMPHYQPAWRQLGESLLRQEKYTDAREVVRQLSQIPSLECEGMLLQSELAKAQKQLGEARGVLETARKRFPDELQPLQSLCQLLFEAGEWEGAEVVLCELAERTPTEGSVYCNLGTVYFLTERLEQAVTMFQQSIDHRPNHVPTYILLGRALHDLHRTAEARSAWEKALELDPGCTEAKELLQKYIEDPQ